MTDVILKFPRSKRRFTIEEEQEIRSCSNLIYQIATDQNPFVKPEQKVLYMEQKIKELIKKLCELDEDNK